MDEQPSILLYQSRPRDLALSWRQQRIKADAEDGARPECLLAGFVGAQRHSGTRSKVVE